MFLITNQKKTDIFEIQQHIKSMLKNSIFKPYAEQIANELAWADDFLKTSYVSTHKKHCIEQCKIEEMGNTLWISIFVSETRPDKFAYIEERFNFELKRYEERNNIDYGDSCLFSLYNFPLDNRLSLIALKNNEEYQQNGCYEVPFSFCVNNDNNAFYSNASYAVFNHQWELVKKTSAADEYYKYLETVSYECFENTPLEPHIPTLRKEIIDIIRQLYEQIGITIYAESIKFVNFNNNNSIIKIIFNFEDTFHNRTHIPSYDLFYKMAKDYEKKHNILYPVEIIFVLENISNQHSVLQVEDYRDIPQIYPFGFYIRDESKSGFESTKLKQIDKLLNIIQKKIDIDNIVIYPLRSQYNKLQLWFNQKSIEKKDKGKLWSIVVELLETGHFHINENEVKLLKKWDNDSFIKIEVQLYDSIDMFFVQSYILDKFECHKRIKRVKKPQDICVYKKCEDADNCFN